MAEHSSVAKVVQQITETLSDAVAQLVVLVVALQEQNAEMPPNLPNAAEAVCNASGTLVNVARALGDEEYNDYPDICGQILNAADGVEKAAIAMTIAVKAVATSRDRAAGWSQLVECCKIIAGKTIVLLQIVYGADLYRLFSCSDITFEALNRIDSTMAAADPQSFANIAGDAATRANQLGEFVRSKAADTESPILQASLAEAADMLQQDANGLIESANRLLHNPSSEAAQKQFADLLEQIKTHIKKVTEPLQDDLQSAVADLARLHTATQGGRFEDLFPAPKAAPGQKSPSQDLADEPVVVVAYRGCGLADKLEVAACLGDAKAVSVALKKIDTTNADLQAGAMLAASTLDDPIRRKRLTMAMEDLVQLLPLHREAVNRTVSDPKKKDALHNANKQLKDKYDTIADILRPGAAASSAISEQQRKIEKVKNAAEKGDVAGLDVALDELQDVSANLQRRVEARVREIDDPVTKKEIFDALSDLEKLLPLEVVVAKRLVKNPHNRQAQNELIDTFEKAKAALTIMEAVADPMGDREIVVASNQGEAESNKLCDAARSGDKEAVAEAAKRLQRSNIKLAKQARAKAVRMDDPAKRRELLAAIDELERLLPEQLTAASEAVNNPRDAGKAARLVEVTDIVLTRIAQVEGSVESAAPVAAAAKKEKKMIIGLNEALHQGNAKAIEVALKELQNANELLLQRGREEEKNKVNPQRRKELANALDELQRLLPLQIKLVKDSKDKPKDTHAKKLALEVNAMVREAVDSVVRKAIPAPKDKAMDAVSQSQDELDRLLDAVRKEDPSKVATAIKSMAASNLRLVDEARKQAQNTDDMLKMQGILDAIDDLERLLPLHMTAAREALAAPQDKEKQAKLEEINERLKDVSEAVVTTMAADVDEASACAANQQAKGAARLANAAYEGDARAVEMAAKSLAKKQPKLARQARAKAAKTDDPELRKEIMDALDALEALIPKQIQAAKEATVCPEDAQKRQKLEEANVELMAAFEELSWVMAPVEPVQALVEAVNKESSAIAQLRASAQKGDVPKGEEAVCDLEESIKKIVQNAESEVIRADDDKSKRTLADGINELETLLLKIRPSATTALSNPKDKKALKTLFDDLDKIAAASERVLDSSKAKPLSEARKQEKSIERLGIASKNSDPQAIAASARALARRAPKLAEQARAQARRTDDPIKKKAILAVVEELERLLPHQMAASLAVASNPDNLEAKQNLDYAMADYTDLLSTLEAAIRPITKDKVREAAEREVANLGRVLEQIRKGDPRNIEESLRQLEQDNDLLAQHARAESAKDPSANKALREAVGDLENLMALVGDSARLALKTPNEKRTQEALEGFVKRLEDRVHEIAEHMDPAYRNKKEREVTRAAADLDVIVPRINEMCERVKKNPNDRKAVEELEEAISRSQFPLEVIGRSRAMSLEQEVVQSRIREKEALSTLEEEARRGNLQGIETEALKVTMAQETFVERARRRAEESNDHTKKKRILEAISDLERLLPETIRASRRVAQNTSDATARKDLAELNSLMVSALERGEREVVPTVEATVLDATARLPHETEKLIDSFKDGDEFRALGALSELDRMVKKVAERTSAAAEAEADPKARKDLQQAVSKLEDILAQLKSNTTTFIKTPHDRRAQALLTEAAQGLALSISNISVALKAETMVEAQIQEATLCRLIAAAKRKDARELADTTKTMAGHHKKLTEQVRAEAARSDPIRQRQMMDSVTELEALLPRQINAVKESLQQPANEEKQEALGRMVDGSLAALASLQETVRPTPAKAAEKLATRDAAHMAILQGLAKRGDKQNVEVALGRIRQNHEELKKQGQDAMEKLRAPEQREKLGRALLDLDTLMDKLARDAQAVAVNINDKQRQASSLLPFNQSLDDSIHQMKKPVDVIQDIIKNSEEAKQSSLVSATAIVMAARSRKMDTRGLLDAANNLASHLNSLAQNVSAQAHKSRDTATGKGASALDLDALLARLDKIGGDVKPITAPEAMAIADESTAGLDSLLGDLQVLAQTAPPPKSSSLEASIKQVADNLKRRSRAVTGAGSEQMTGKHTANIGGELSKLADACKDGQRQQFLISARSISGYVRALSSDVKGMGDKCPDPELKERLTRSTQALQNFAIQLKILAAVKAASTTPDPDAENQLAILTQNLGHMLNNTISAVHVAHLKYHTGTV